MILTLFKQYWPWLPVAAFVCCIVIAVLPLPQRPIPPLIMNLEPDVPIIIQDLSTHLPATAGKYLLIHRTGKARLESVLHQQPVLRPFPLQLASADWQAIEALRREWCKETPFFPTVSADQPHYSMSVRCADTTMILRDIPAEQAPRAVTQLFEHLSN